MRNHFASLRRRIQRLEQQPGTDPYQWVVAMTPEARERRIKELLLEFGVPADELDAGYAATMAMSPAELQAWMAAQSEG